MVDARAVQHFFQLCSSFLLFMKLKKATFESTVAANGELAQLVPVWVKLFASDILAEPVFPTIIGK